MLYSNDRNKLRRGGRGEGGRGEKGRGEEGIQRKGKEMKGGSERAREGGTRVVKIAR